MIILFVCLFSTDVDRLTTWQAGAASGSRRVLAASPWLKLGIKQEGDAANISNRQRIFMTL